MNARMLPRAFRRVRRRGRGFTLVEMLIVVGAVGLIAVGIGKLFSSTGETVKIGKRLSYMNELATTLENRIRRDIAAATRDGPLVIRHKLITTSTGAGVPLSADDRNPAPRMRRADEITFLAQGKFFSNREPVWPGRVASSPVARIYLGHGMVRADTDALTTPELTDDPEGGAGSGPRAWPPGLGENGPNQYASDWILLRHVTLLARPQETQSQLPVGASVPTGLFTTRNWKDSPSQIQLQPAAPSVFRFDPLHPNNPDRAGWGYANITSGAPQALTLPGLADWVRTNDSSVGWPQFMSGLVDVASIDPAMIRTRIVSGGLLPFDASFNPGRPPSMTTMPDTLAALRTNNNPAHISKMLMAAILPSADPWVQYGGTIATPQNPLNNNPHERRMICAVKPADFTGNLTSNGSSAWPANQSYRQQDQAMLSASNLAVGCSEFSIEWSFGDVYPAVDSGGRTPRDPENIGKLIWHGRAPEGASSTDFVTSPYRGESQHQSAARYDVVGQAWSRKNGTVASRPLPAALIHWPVDYTDPTFDGTLPPEVPFYSFFGYVDPTYRLPTTGANQVDPDTIPWPWPKLLRFTISLTDPNDPNFEQTYQFIVDLPTADQRQ